MNWPQWDHIDPVFHPHEEEIHSSDSLGASYFTPDTTDLATIDGVTSHQSPIGHQLLSTITSKRPSTIVPCPIQPSTLLADEHNTVEYSVVNETFGHDSLCDAFGKYGLDPKLISTGFPQIETHQACGGHFAGYFVDQKQREDHGTLEQSTRNELNFSPTQLRCGWVGCPYDGGLTTDMSLWRHIKSTHLFPGEYKCHSCNVVFGRTDNLQQHVRSHHRVGQEKKRRSNFSS